MASTITRRKTIRIANETDDYFKDKPLNRMVECLQRLLECGRLSWDGEELIVNDKVRLPDKLVDELEEIGGYFNMTAEEMIREFIRLLNEGEIVYEDKTLYALAPEWVEEIENKCKAKGLTVETVIAKVLDMIDRGQI